MFYNKISKHIHRVNELVDLIISHQIIIFESLSSFAIVISSGQTSSGQTSSGQTGII